MSFLSMGLLSFSKSLENANFFVEGVKLSDSTADKPDRVLGEKRVGLFKSKSAAGKSKFPLCPLGRERGVFLKGLQLGCLP